MVYIGEMAVKQKNLPSRSRRKKKRKLGLVKIICVVLVFLIMVFVVVDHQLRPLIKAMAANQADIFSTNSINKAVCDELSSLDVTYDDVVNLQRDDTGKVLAITTNMKAVNRLKASVTVAIQEKLSSIERRQLNVPIGTLTGTEIFNGRGPKVPMKVTMSGSAVTNFRSNFENAGINQTKHQLYLEVSTSIFALIPGYPVTTSVETSIIIAETVIVGAVPSTFADICA